MQTWLINIISRVYNYNLLLNIPVHDMLGTSKLLLYAHWISNKLQCF